MTDHPLKRVLVVDDHVFTCNDLRAAFLKYNTGGDAEFRFEVDTTTTITGAIDKVRTRGLLDQYQVIVLDLSLDLDGNDRDGLHVANVLGLYRRLGQAIPVEIIFSGYADLKTCVEAMRHGVWDVIDKSDDGAEGAFARVVASAVARLKALDLQEQLNVMAVAWLEQTFDTLQAHYGGQVIAIWHEPEVGVVAHAPDIFALELQLASWRVSRPLWMYPFVAQIPGDFVVATTSLPSR